MQLSSLWCEVMVAVEVESCPQIGNLSGVSTCPECACVCCFDLCDCCKWGSRGLNCPRRQRRPCLRATLGVNLHAAISQYMTPLASLCGLTLCLGFVPTLPLTDAALPRPRRLAVPDSIRTLIGHTSSKRPEGSQSCVGCDDRVTRASRIEEASRWGHGRGGA
jgi:hypothetical protein